MRTIPVTFGQMLQSGRFKPAVCAKVTRLDGQVLGLTNLWQDLVIDGVTYHAEGALDATAVETRLGTGIDNLEVVGLLSSPLITELDLRAGRYEGAAIELFVVDWSQNPITERVVLLTGYLGDVTYSRGTWRTEVRSLMQRLAQQVGELTSQTCLVKQLFDLRCSPPGNTTPTANPANFRRTRTVAAVNSLVEVVFGSDVEAADYYRAGRVKFNTGLNAGLEREVKSHVHTAGQACLVLHEPFPFAVAVGDEAMLEAGCDRLLSTCINKFQNATNMRGFPHLPGIDAIIQVGRK